MTAFFLHAQFFSTEVSRLYGLAKASGSLPHALLHCEAHTLPCALPTPPRSCGYCTFAMPPAPGRRAYMTLDEVMAVARLGAEAGCTEALFTLGEPGVVQGAQPLHRDMMLLCLLCYAAHTPRRACACHATCHAMPAPFSLRVKVITQASPRSVLLFGPTVATRRQARAAVPRGGC